MSDLPDCTHHWLFDPPEGPTSRGVCKLCGSETEAYNDIPDRYFSADHLPKTEMRELEQRLRDAEILAGSPDRRGRL